jgi:hypothetical protein
MDKERFDELLIQALQHERGGIDVYDTALRCVVNEDLKDEWQRYLDQTRTHAEILVELCTAMAIDPERTSDGRTIVHDLGSSLVDAMNAAAASGDSDLAQLVACDCVTIAETKDHANWELLGKAADHVGGSVGDLFKAACTKVEDEEDEHLYHSRGWGRELWIQWLGMQSVLPPPEETKDVKTALAAARAEKSAPKHR